MPGIIISDDEIDAAPPVARLWLERRLTWAFRQREVNRRSSAEPASSPKTQDEELTQAGGGSGLLGSPAEVASPPCADAIATETRASVPALDLHKLTAERAYEIWENEGKPHGYDLIHWKTAEQEIMDSAQRPR